MSTRGAIAVPTARGKGWWGRYHHYDSNPFQLGRELYRLYHTAFDRDHTAMVKTLIEDHPAGWSNIIRPYTPHVFERADFDHSGFRGLDDPEQDLYPACYCHGERSEDEDTLTCDCPDSAEGCGPLFIEWAYVLTRTGMFVLTSWHPEFGQAYKHRLMALVDWDRPEPDWEQAQRRAHLIDIPDLTL